MIRTRGLVKKYGGFTAVVTPPLEVAFLTIMQETVAGLASGQGSGPFSGGPRPEVDR